MKLTNLNVQKEPEVDDAVLVKADFGADRVIASIPRVALDDYFPHRPHLTSVQRCALVESNRDAIASILQRKCERGEWHDENRFGSTVKRVDIDKADLTVPRLTDARLTMEEKAGFKPMRR
jgi:hypothetical protein